MSEVHKLGDFYLEKSLRKLCLLGQEQSPSPSPTQHQFSMVRNGNDVAQILKMPEKIQD